jgi:hypothetical protein
MSLDSVVGLKTRVRARQPGVRIPAESRKLTLLQNVQIGCRAYPASYLMNIRGFPPELKQPGCDVDHSPPSIAGLKNEWSHSSNPSICLQGVEWDKFTFYVQLRYITLSWQILYFHGVNFRVVKLDNFEI